MTYILNYTNNTHYINNINNINNDIDNDIKENLDFFYFLKKLISDNKIKTIDDLREKFAINSNITYKNYYINLTIDTKRNISILHTPKITFNIGVLNMENQMIIDNLLTCIIDNDIFMPIVNINPRITYNKPFLESTSLKNKKIRNIIDNIEYLNEKDKIEFYPSYDGDYIVLFYHNYDWNILHNNKIICYEEASSNDSPLIFKLFRNLFEETTTTNELNKNISYHFELIHHRLGKCIYDIKFGNEIRYLIHIYSIDMKTLLKINMDINIKKHERIYLSCKDELLAYIDKINTNMIFEGKLLQRGVLMTYYNSDNIGISTDNFFEINFDTDIYSNISSKIKPYNNIHHAYLIMYLNNECNNILSYITHNYLDIVKRINNSLKTISKELLDIYFLTKERQNPELYEALPRIYRDIKFAIHGIYIKKRQNDINENDNLDEIQLKSSIELNDIYTYIKNELGGENVIELYSKRVELINKINTTCELKKYEKLNIFNLDCSYTILQTELMLNISN
jgi:hypothetical protein